MSRSIRVAHITTVDLSLRFLLRGQLKALRDAGFEVAAISAPGPWSAGLEAEGIRHIPWPHATRAWHPWADVRAFGELLGILRRERFDVVHTHNPKPGILGRAAARMTGVPCIVNTVHGLYATPDDRLAKKTAVLGIERLAGRLSDLELYQSEEDLTWARRMRLAVPERSALLGNGVDLSLFDPEAVPAGRTAALRRELGIADGALVVATVGRLVAEKGYREFFAAAREVRAATPEARFLAIGDSDPGERGAIGDDEIAAASADVTFTGCRQDVRDLLSLADVFVLASWREGVPRAAIEAAAMGKPLILTNIRGCREVARNGVEGVLVPARQPAPLGAAVDLLLRDPALRNKLGTAARARALERFDERRVVGLTIARYRALLSGTARVAQPHGAAQVRRAHRTEAPSLARIHREALPDAFLPALGDRFLRRLYRALAEDEDAVVLVAEVPEGVVGFATGVLSTRDFYRGFYWRHAIPAMAVVAPRVLRRGVLHRVLETARFATRARVLPDAQLTSIAVLQGWRKRGVGRMLVTGVVSSLAERGAGEIAVVAGAANEDASSLYARMGFRRSGPIVVHEGSPSNLWIIGCRS